MDLALTPLSATLIFFVTCLAGYQYRRVWKTEGPTYQYWLFGTVAGAGLIALGFIPIHT
ncbi:MAG: hypothetical protein AAGA87_14430 [Pseudomonadota bacterium]